MDNKFDHGDPPDEIAWAFMRWLEHHAEGMLGQRTECLAPDDRANLKAAVEHMRPAFDEFVSVIVKPLSRSHRPEAMQAFALINDLMNAAFAIGASGVLPEGAEQFLKKKLGSKGGTRSGEVRRENRAWVISRRRTSGGNKRRTQGMVPRCHRSGNS